MLRKIGMAVAFWMVLSGCNKDRSDQFCQYDECAYKAPAAEITALQQYLTDNSITAIQHCSGLFYAIQDPGTGAVPRICDYIAVRYKGMLTNGNVFEERTDPFAFQLAELITAWKNGLLQIRQGGKIRLYIPPSLGYGNQERKDGNGNVIIPANSILIFDIDLVQVQ